MYQPRPYPKDQPEAPICLTVTRAEAASRMYDAKWQGDVIDMLIKYTWIPTVIIVGIYHLVISEPGMHSVPLTFH